MGSNGEAVKMELGVAQRCSAKLRRHSEAFDAMAVEISDVMEALDAGAGEFSTTMSPGSGAFGASWSEAVVRCERSSNVIADTITRFGTDLTFLDLRDDLVR